MQQGAEGAEGAEGAVYHGFQLIFLFVVRGVPPLTDDSKAAGVPPPPSINARPMCPAHSCSTRSRCLCSTRAPCALRIQCARGAWCQWCQYAHGAQIARRAHGSTGARAPGSIGHTGTRKRGENVPLVSKRVENGSIGTIGTIRAIPLIRTIFKNGLFFRFSLFSMCPALKGANGANAPMRPLSTIVLMGHKKLQCAQCAHAPAMCIMGTRQQRRTTYTRGKTMPDFTALFVAIGFFGALGFIAYAIAADAIDWIRNK